MTVMNQHGFDKDLDKELEESIRSRLEPLEPNKGRQCAECGNDFTPKGSYHRFCSGKCRERWNARQPKRKAYRKEFYKRFHEEHPEYRLNYSRSEAGKAAMRKYNHSAKGIVNNRRREEKRKLKLIPFEV